MSSVPQAALASAATAAPPDAADALARSLRIGQEVARDQAAAINQLAEQLDGAFSDAVRRVLTSSGQLLTTGLGKSGLIAAKVAATMASTGTQAKFIHPVEGLHGDLGIVQPHDLLLAFSKSGHTEEVVRFVGHFKRIGGDVIAVCEPGRSPLAELSQYVLAIPRCAEAGPLQLAPTTSSTLMLVLGDALAMALLDARGFKPEQFARYHPEGSLGKRLLLRAADIMHAGTELPRVPDTASFHDMLIEITGKHIGMTCIVDSAGRLVGVFTDGDLRRLLSRVDQPLSLPAREAWRLSRRDPSEPPVPHSTIAADVLAVECLRLMREAQITSLVVADEGGRPVGILRLQDIIRAGVG